MSGMIAVIPAAGFGTRMLPLSSVVPKELLPVNGLPVIHHVVREAVDAGIREIVLVISEGKEAVIDYFKPNRRLEGMLRSKGLSAELAMMEELWAMADVSAVYQPGQLGLGHAVLCAEACAAGRGIAVLLGDSIVRSDRSPSFTSELMEAMRAHQQAVVGVREVDAAHTGRYGILEGQPQPDGTLRASRVIEKPLPGETASTLAFCGRYVFPNAIFGHLRSTPKGRNSEIQLTDAMQRLLSDQGLMALPLQGIRHDIGNPEGLALANRMR